MLKLLPKKYFHRSKGQVAIAILFVALIGLIFYAVTMNIGRMSQTKTIVTAASNLATAQLASMTVSSAQQMYKVNLGGENPKCGITGALAQLIGVILTIVGLILTPFTAGGSLVLSAIGVALAAGGLIVQTCYIEPAITNAWNKMMEKSLTTNERYVENALQVALQNAATDPKKVDDLTDINSNGRFKGSPKGDDQVGRFSILYTKRVHDITQGAYHEAMLYLDAVDRFVYGDGWSLTDKPGIECEFGIGDSMVIGNDDPPLVPAECNPCCLPETTTEPNPNDPNVTITHHWIALSCTQPGDDHLTNEKCDVTTPYPGYPYVFSVVYQNMYNNVINGAPGKISFLEQIGRDDEHEAFNRRFFQATLDEKPGYNAVAQLDIDSSLDSDLDPTNDPEDYADRWGHPDQIPQDSFGLRTAPTNFYMGDVDGYYPEDLRTGVFPFFWQMKHFGVDLNTLTKTDRMYPECVWCDPADPENVFSDADPNVDSNHDGNLTNDPDNGSVCSPCYPDMIVYNDIDGVKEPVQQLSLGPMEDISYPFSNGYTVDILYEKKYFVEGPGFSVSGEPPVGLDMVSETNSQYEALMQEHPGFPSKDVWKEGSPFFSSSDWPYEEPDYYTEDQMDKMDWIIYGLQEYVTWAFRVLANKQYVASQLKRMSDDGELNYWKVRLQRVSFAMGEILGKLRDWKDVTYKTTGCGEAWCIPGDPSQCSSPPPPDEEATFGEGKIEDVASCLEWNSDPAVDPDHPEFAGNAGRFKECMETCTVAACTNLPRSLVPNFNPNNIDQAALNSDCDPNASDWAKNMVQSIAEAQKQVIKMSMRAKFLRSLIYRRNHLIEVLQEGKEHIDVMAAVPDPTKPIPSGRSVVYGWLDDPNETLAVKGRWHFVKAEASLPSLLPWIRTYTKGAFKTKRCYELTNTDGDLWVRVTRFDQPYDEIDEKKLEVKYGSGQDKMLWKFWTYNPADAQAVHDLDLSGIVDTCRAAGAFAKDHLGNEIPGAFITSDQVGGSCNKKVEKALELGVSTITCAHYGFQKATYANDGFAFKFKQCN